MTDISDVHYVAHSVAKILEGAAQDVLEDIGPQVSNMGVVIDRGPTGVKGDMPLFQGFELLE